MSDQADDTASMGGLPMSGPEPLAAHEALLLCRVFDPPAATGAIGKLDRFDILRLIGEGGMGSVFLGREPLTGALVAIKVMKARDIDDPQAVHRFLTEARHMYHLSHPRILRVLEVSDRAAGPYYVMPYIDGGNLQKLCTPDAPLAPERILNIARHVAAALAYSHSRGIVHRDLKPGNVLLDKQENAYLTDFGLVRTVFNDSIVDASASHLEGTAPYMSPAVARGEAEDTRCDIYAFGALLYELLTGRPPYTGRTPWIVIDQVLKGPPEPILRVNPKADPGLVTIATGCMARELCDRYAVMEDVVTDLDRVTKKRAPHGSGRRHGTWRRPPPTVIAAAAAVLLLLFVLAFVPIAFAGHRAVGASARLRAIEEESARLREQVPALQREAARVTVVQGLSRELAAVRPERPSLAAVLLDLTRRIGPDMWLSRFAWSDGKIDLQICTYAETVDLEKSLEESPVLGDVIHTAKTVSSDGKKTLRLELVARFDTDAERQQVRSTSDAKPASSAPPTPASGTSPPTEPSGKERRP